MSTADASSTFLLMPREYLHPPGSVHGSHRADVYCFAAAVCPTNYSVGDACNAACPDYETCGTHALSTIGCLSGVCSALQDLAPLAESFEINSVDSKMRGPVDTVLHPWCRPSSHLSQLLERSLRGVSLGLA